MRPKVPWVKGAECTHWTSDWGKIGMEEKENQRLAWREEENECANSPLKGRNQACGICWPAESRIRYGRGVNKVRRFGVGSVQMLTKGARTALLNQSKKKEAHPV